MISRYERIILDNLLDKYEKSKSFTGDNKVNQRFTVKASKLFPRYTDHSNYEVFKAVNEAVDILVRKQFVIAKANSAKVYDDIALSLDKLEQIYQYINRLPKKDVNESVLQLMEKHKDINDILNRYCNTQCERISMNKSVQFFNEDINELENVLIAVDELLKVETETFIRDFSIRVFKDSKVFDLISSKTVSLLYEYGDFPEKEQVLGNLNIVKNPTYVNFKGAGTVLIKGQKIDLTELNGDIAISSSMLRDIESVTISGSAVITIENLTSFHTFHNKDMLAIYLGGYHNNVRREFIKKIHQQNPEVDFYHFGDIDAGGFYIFEHLRQQTQVDFKPYKMDLETLKAHSDYTKKLTENDRDRLLRLRDSRFSEVIGYMLENNCKLEQEAVALG